MDNPEKLATLGTQDTRRRKKPNTICVGHHYAQTNTNSVKKTQALLQTAGCKDKPNIVLCRFNNVTTHCMLYIEVGTSFIGDRSSYNASSVSHGLSNA